MNLNILFLTYFEVTPQKGGIERVTDIVATNLSEKNGIKCYSAYYYSNNLVHTNFSGKICLEWGEEYNQLHRFISENNISVVINQQIYSLNKIIVRLRQTLFVYYVYFQHDRTAIDLCSDFSYYKYAAHHGNNTRKRCMFAVKFMIAPVYAMMRKLYYRHLYRSIYHNVDTIVLLSRYFIPVFLKSMGKLSDSRKCISIINNSVTLPSVTTPEDISKKLREVLIVSRLTEERKRISLAIKIWQLYQNSFEESKEWILRIVGNGEYASDYKKLVAKKKIPNIIFEGQVEDTIEYYRRASAFIMTSDAEGWGLTLVEAQQMGVVPIAFNSYESIHEIIQDGVNGVLVKNSDCTEFVRKLHELLNDDNKRRSMAINGLEVTRIFSVDRMISQWLKILDNLS
ncbi:glycosyltransferase [Bacteroides fluxus]|uniref:glycosyltransferase n=1 Tax=Bacteroides fluxus TaxID=626930 RepID=UPI0023576579|nr:glycosyltransferase [Bacteroides fluxus]